MADRIDAEALMAEQREIEAQYRSLRFAQKLRHHGLSCMKFCGGDVKAPFHLEPNWLLGKAHECFGDCMNTKLAEGPYLNELETIPTEFIAKKFVWSHGLEPAAAENTQ